jgi:DMSO/TMAO reductase YedYZ molybdopterin-dependent catalytic subunit
MSGASGDELRVGTNSTLYGKNGDRSASGMTNRDGPTAKQPLRRFPVRPHQLIERVTPLENLFVVAPLGAPDPIDMQTWELRIDGLVERPTVLTFNDLLQLPKREMQAFHQCAGNPLRWDFPTRRITNVVWGGVDLTLLLRLAGVRTEARFLWSYGRDSGVYLNESIDEYIKDLPLEAVEPCGALLAYELNGVPLPIEHGFPLRLVVPGHYGTNSVKWLKRLRLENERCPGFFTTTLYNDPTPPTDALPAGGTRPVWGSAPESIIVSPEPNAKLSANTVEIWGWTWAQNEISAVSVSTDAGASWQSADLEPRRGYSWQRFSLLWHPNGPPRQTQLMSCATDCKGEVQPSSGARNAIHCVAVSIGDGTAN